MAADARRLLPPRVRHALAGEKGGVWRASLGLPFVDALLLALAPLVTAEAMLRFSESGLEGASLPWLAALAGLAGVRLASGAAGQAVALRLELRAARVLRRALFGHAQRVPMARLDAAAPGEVQRLLGRDVDALAGWIASASTGALALGLLAVCAWLRIAMLSWPVALFAAASIPGLVWLRTRRDGGAAGVAACAAAAARDHAALFGAIEESVDARLSLRLMRAGPGEEARLDEAASGLERSRIALAAAHRRHQTAARLVGTGLLVAGVATLLALVGPTAPARQLEVLLTTLVLARALGGLAAGLAQWREARSAGERIEAWLSIECPAPAHAPASLPGDPLVARDLRVRRGTHRVIARGLLRLVRGRATALVGESGAGKTSLALALAGVHPVAGGRLVAEAGSVTVVPQHAEILARTLRENLAIGRPGAPDAQLRAALRRVGLGDWLDALPDGLETPLGAGGRALSGGEAQRVALARALVVDPPVLVLDEALSMVEPGAERQFFESNRAWLRERAVLLVTHRGESLPLMDRVVELQEGRLVERAVRHARGTVRHRTVTGTLDARSRQRTPAAATD